MVTRPELTQQEMLSDTDTGLPIQLERLPDEVLLHIISCAR